MTSRNQLGRALAWVAAAGFLATAALHATGYGDAKELAAGMESGLAAVIPGLWLMFSLDLVVVGLIVALVAWRMPHGGPLILAVAAICPIGAAVMQVVFIGFIPPTAILLVVGTDTLAAAVLMGGPDEPDA